MSSNGRAKDGVRRAIGGRRQVFAVLNNTKASNIIDLAGTAGQTGRAAKINPRNQGFRGSIGLKGISAVP
jgi:hypothetical protein